jgi:hypothetical protein
VDKRTHAYERNGTTAPLPLHRGDICRAQQKEHIGLQRGQLSHHDNIESITDVDIAVLGPSKSSEALARMASRVFVHRVTVRAPHQHAYGPPSKRLTGGDLTYLPPIVVGRNATGGEVRTRCGCRESQARAGAIDAVRPPPLSDRCDTQRIG